MSKNAEVGALRGGLTINGKRSKTGGKQLISIKLLESPSRSWEFIFFVFDTWRSASSSVQFRRMIHRGNCDTLL